MKRVDHLVDPNNLVVHPEYLSANAVNLIANLTYLTAKVAEPLIHAPFEAVEALAGRFGEIVQA